MFRPTKFIQNPGTLILTILVEKFILKKGNKKICKFINIYFLSRITVIFSLISFSVLLLSFHDGDVESNLRRNYTIENVVGSNREYHQDDERFGDTAGVQYT